MSVEELLEYRYRGARALVLLHERHLQAFLSVWRKAKASGVRLPATKDPNYASLDALLYHMLRAARGYMTWICEKLALPDPGIAEQPAADRIEAEADRFLSHLLARWRMPLAGVEETRFDEIHVSRWGIQMSIESMLEHAVVHPMRHTFQLEELMEKKA
jgi:uncharacterized damage-inducible protein DinB